jgi:hypothetical protein
MLIPGDKNDNDLQTLYRKGELHLIREIEIDNDSLPEGIVLKQAGDFAQNNLNYLFITDNYQNNIKVFDDKGNFVKIIGQKGQGPGDLMQPEAICYNGQYIIVWEQGNQRFSFFSNNGDFVKMIKPLTSLRVKAIKAIPGGSFVLETELNRNPGKKGQICILDLYSADFNKIHSIFKQDVLRSLQLTDPVRINVSVPYGPDVSWDVMANGTMVTGFQEKYEIGVFDPGKGKLFSFEHQAKPLKITARDKQKVYDLYRVITGQGKIKEAPKQLLDKIPFPLYRPVFGKILADPENNILVFPAMSAGDEKYSHFDAFDSRGRFIKNVRLKGKIDVPIRILFNSTSHLWCLNIVQWYDYRICQYRIVPH